MLLVAYGATLAPGVTFWDAGELVAAVHAFGIPHPPGTPLWVAAARAWRVVAAPLSTALATNLFSALATALAAGALAWLLARATRANLAAFGAAVCAGAMSTVWLDANETEVYAAVLLLAMATLLCADRAGGRTDGATERSRGRWTVLTAYGIALAVPMHLAALVAAPAAVVLAAQDAEGTVRWERGVLLSGVAIATAGAGLANARVAGLGAWVIAVAAVVALRRRRRGEARRGERAGREEAGAVRWPIALGAAGAVVLALSALAILPLRAMHDPAINAGNPTGWTALWEVVGRRQYGAPPLWPRQAPLWLQLGNLFEYADWQVALGLAPGVGPSWARTPFTIAFAVLGVYGAAVHRRLDRRSWRALAVLLLSASVGLVLYLNFKAGASFGWGILPDSAPHEARDRDYFFALAFWTWGAWAGFGAVQLAARARPALRVAGVAVAMLPIALNWSAVDRARSDESTTARRLAAGMLWSTPAHGVLLAGGDNDAFPCWYAQVVEGERPDVTVVVAPLLGARWYRAQLWRRDSLAVDAPPAPAGGTLAEGDLIARVAASARARGRPVAVSITAGTARRDAAAEAGAPWVLRGLAYVRDGD
ncbi:MAG: DUF2723 domain-containing protein, partial [Gemmatimonadaceae bacterium]|nr:DUF2723 domain-containing protein [Gemmatimonadaceae bacterium]